MKNKEERQFIYVKKRNRRVQIVFLPKEDAVLITTKRLVSKKDRKITEATVVYTKETLYQIAEMMDLMVDGSEEFKSFLERGAVAISNTETLKASTNIKSLATK